MVLTRAQRAQTKATEPAEAPKPRVTKAKSTTTKTTKSTATTKAKESIEEEKEETISARKVSRATSTTASSAARSKTAKSEPKEDEKPKAKAGRPRKQVQFAEEPAKEKKEVSESSNATTATRGRPRKTPLVATASTTTLKPALSTRGRPRKTPVAEAPVKSTRDVTKELKSSALGKPIRPKKSAVVITSKEAIQASNTKPEACKPIVHVASGGVSPDASESHTQDSRKPNAQEALMSRLAPPIRASPMKMSRDTPVSSMTVKPLAFPALEVSFLSPSKSLGSPMRLPPRVNPLIAESPLRATPIRPLNASLLSHAPLAQPVFANPLLQSPIRPSAKKPMAVPASTANPAKTPLRSLGTPIRRNLGSSSMIMQFPQTAVPQKRSFMESPIRPRSAQPPKRMKLLDTPSRPCSADDNEPVACIKNLKIVSIKKSVSFESPQHQEVQENEPETFTDVQSPTHKFHRISAVTEVTEPEESVDDVFRINPTMEAMEEPATLDELVETEDIQDVEMTADISMSEILGADFAMSSLIKEPTTVIEPLDAAMEVDSAADVFMGDAFNVGRTFEEALRETTAAPELVAVNTEMMVTPKTTTSDMFHVDAVEEEFQDPTITVEQSQTELEMQQTIEIEVEQVESINHLVDISQELSIPVEMMSAEVGIEAEVETIDPFVEIPEDWSSTIESTKIEVEMEIEAVELLRDALEQSIAASVPESAPEPLTILNDMKFFVDVWAADGSNANQFFAPLLEELGATVSSEWTSEITHVLFKDGKTDTLKKVVESEGSVRCLNVGWAVE